MNLDTLTKFTEHFSSEQLIVNADRCLNARFKQIDCHICVDACPVDAIHLEGRQVRLDSDSCARCGACVWQCPTEVFAQPSGLKSRLRETVQAVGNAPVELRCPQVKDDKTIISDATIIQHSRCLAELSPAQLIELAADRPVWLNDQACAACPLKDAHASILRAGREANRWRAAFDRPRHIHPLTTDADQNARPHAARVFDSANPPSDRRAFFKMFTRSLVEAGASAAKSNDTDQVKPVDQRLPRHVPTERARLLSAIGKLGQPQSVPLDLPRVQVKGPDCTACGLCARFCPSGALKYMSVDEEFALVFQPKLCLGQVCDICVLACPERAVVTQPAVVSAALLAKKPLIVGALAKCQKCGEPIAKGSDLPTTCFACRPQNIAGDLLASF